MRENTNQTKKNKKGGRNKLEESIERGATKQKNQQREEQSIRRIKRERINPN